MPKRVFPKAYQNLIDSILYTRRRMEKRKGTSKYFNGQSRKHMRPRHRLCTQKRCTRRK